MVMAEGGGTLIDPAPGQVTSTEQAILNAANGAPVALPGVSSGGKKKKKKKDKRKTKMAANPIEVLPNFPFCLTTEHRTGRHLWRMA